VLAVLCLDTLQSPRYRTWSLGSEPIKVNLKFWILNQRDILCYFNPGWIF
jgi:hypothetical protein